PPQQKHLVLIGTGDKRGLAKLAVVALPLEFHAERLGSKPSIDAFHGLQSGDDPQPLLPHERDLILLQHRSTMLNLLKIRQRVAERRSNRGYRLCRYRWTRRFSLARRRRMARHAGARRQ